ncbi:bromodomain adjacent to zinc finger domain protein 2-like isoform X2 [Oscarella lobularis]|uniref:bromodomain adjacent to zinc finger domain protein 2-like isoform X2 n=1 Tax=Oscarella lobularis TaxID=121494 RepID=UPI003313BDDF
MEPNERPQTPYSWPNGTYPVYGSGLLPSPYMMAPPSPLSAPSHLSPYLFSPHPGSDWWSRHYMPPPPPPPPPPHIHSSYYGNGASGIPWAPPPLLAAPPSMNPYSQLPPPPPPPWINPPPVHMPHQHQENNVEDDDNDKDVVAAAVSPAVPTPASPSSVPSIDNDNDNDASYVPPSMTTATPATTTSKLQRNNVVAPASATSPSILPKKRRSKVVDRKTIELPLALGWRRQVRRREPVVVEGTSSSSSSPAKTEVVYVAPCGKRLRSYAAIDDYINAHDLADRLALENFSFSAKLLVGDVVDAVAAAANERRRQTIDATGILSSSSLGSRIVTFPYSSSAFGDVVMTCEFFATFRGFLRLVAPSSSSSSSLDVDFLLRRDVVVDACRRLLTILIDERDEPIRTQCNGIVRGDDVDARTLSEILRLVLVAAAESTAIVVDLTLLMRESFFALDVGVRATIVAFLVNEVMGSKAFGVHLERHQERVHALRKEKWSVECDLRRLKGMLDGEGGDDEERRGTAAAAAASDEESDGDGDGNVGNNHLHTNAVDRAETKKEISKLTALKSQCQEKLHVAMKTLRSLSLGEDRHGRRYWCLPHCSSTGVFVEETERQRNTKENHFKKSSKVETSSPIQGWWLISDADQLAAVAKSLNRKDFREKELYKNLTEKVDRFSSRKKGFRINNLPSEPVDFSSETDREYEQLLEDITNLEERLLSASLQSKGWTPFSRETDGEDDSNYSSLEIASRRLIQIEQATERRYLKPPLQETKQLTSRMLAGGTGQSQENDDDDDDNVGIAACDDDDVPSVSEGLLLWRAAVSRATSPSQLQVCLSHLEKSISWEKSIMKVFCQVCCKGDNEALLLLCDGCDRGVHAYCCKPKLSGIPEGDWYCHSCVRNVADENRCCLCSGSSTTGKIISCGQCPRTFHMRCLDPPMSRIPKEDWCCPVCVKLIESCSKISSPSKRQRNGGDDDEEDEDDVVSSCLSILQDLERQPQSWPFLIPVNKKQVPSYYDIIENPMDFQTIRAKLKDGSYSRKDAFANDVRLVFANCRTFNEDDSEVGIAGLLLSKYFERRWKCN